MSDEPKFTEAEALASGRRHAQAWCARECKPGINAAPLVDAIAEAMARVIEGRGDLKPGEVDAIAREVIDSDPTIAQHDILNRPRRTRRRT